MRSDERVSAVWSANHAYLTNLAFGILGEVTLAEDAVQEAFARLVSVGTDSVDDERGWLIVVTSRICFDKVRSAPRRRELAHDDAALQLASDRDQRREAGDPLDRITLDDEVRLALLVMLENLSPPERVVFVLHDIFRMPFEAIAETVGRPPSSCRQLARRARQRLETEGAGRSFNWANVQHQQITEAFIDACSTGDVDALVHLLDPDVAGDVDLGPLDPRTGSINYGADVVSVNFLRYLGGSTLVAVPGQVQPVILAFLGRQHRAITSLEIRDSQVSEIHVFADPEKVAHVGSRLDMTS